MADEALESPGSKSWLYHPAFPEHWERRPLYSLARWVNGLAFRDIQFGPTGRPVIKIAEIKGGISGQTKFTEQVFHDAVHVRAGDLLFSWSGQPETSIDVFWWRGVDGWLNQHSFRVTPAEGIDPTFFFYLLRYLKPSFIGIARNKQTTGLGHVTKRDLENIEAAYPGLPEQRAIAHTLGTLDDKIELNRRMNETLGAMARALFKSWFVDFDPVRAKAEGRDPALPQPLADLFPDSFEDSELGEIPKGWELGTLGILGELAIGGDWGEDEAFAGAVEASCLRGVDLEHLRQSGHASAPRRWFKLSSLERRALDDRDVLVAGSGAGPTGRPLWMCSDLLQALGPCVYSNFCKRIRCGTAAKAVYLDAWLHGMRESGEIWEHVNGTSVPNLDGNSLLAGKEIPLPPVSLLDRYHDFVRPIWQELYAGQNRTLAALRNTLLPKLISGELRVRAADDFIQEATV